MAERDEIYHPQFVRCPECLRRNLWDAFECRHCGTVMPSQQPDRPQVKDVKKAAQTEMAGLKAYAVITFVLALIIALVSLVAGVIMLLSANSHSEGMLMIVAGFALTVIHVAMGHGLWLERDWAKRGALQMHAIVLIFGLISVLVWIFGVDMRALQYLTDPVLLLALIGMLALWVGVGAEEGERLAVNGPDPTSVEMIMQHSDARPGVSVPLNTGPYPQRAHLPDGPLNVSLPRTIAGNGHSDPEEVRQKQKEQQKLMMGAAMLAFSAFKGVLGKRREVVVKDEPRKKNGSRWSTDEPEPAPKKRSTSTKRSTRKRKNNGDDDMGFIAKFLRG